ncbi:hypothetical protein L1887_46159 [Cichorium endivia]|nr:hypothetical protein L1887_46159 [Cichorium endivia]
MGENAIPFPVTHQRFEAVDLPGRERLFALSGDAVEKNPDDAGSVRADTPPRLTTALTGRAADRAARRQSARARFPASGRAGFWQSADRSY